MRKVLDPEFQHLQTTKDTERGNDCFCVNSPGFDINHVPGHQNITENEQVDQLAKSARKLTFCTLE